MDVITTTADLAAVCHRMCRHPFVTVDTEFLRETTYYPLLCAIQMASPEEAVVIDTLANGLDLDRAERGAQGPQLSGPQVLGQRIFCLNGRA